MTETIHTILSLVGFGGAVVAFFLAVVGRLAEKRVADLEKARDEARAEAKALAERLRVDELETARMAGRMDLAEHRLLELERDQMPKSEIVQLVEGMKTLVVSKFDDMTKRLDAFDAARNRGRYSSSDPNFPRQGKPGT